MNSRRQATGIVLILVSAMVVVLTLVALLLLGTVLGLSRLAGIRVESVRAHLAAASGMEYAAARLGRDAATPDRTKMKTRGDDWTFREGSGVRVEGSANPSYSHGENWVDAAPGSEGAYVLGADGVIPGLGGDDSFAAWSGRLRGAAGAFALRFSLKIESPEGRIPLNAGYLDDRSRGAVAVRDYQEFGTADTVHPYHRGLEHLLNNLGAVLRPMDPPPAVPWTRREDLTAGAGTPLTAVRFSCLGYDLLSRRPEGGYKTAPQWRDILAGIGYSTAECDLFEPYLDLGPYETPAESGRTSTTDGTDFPPYAPVNLSTAPREVLEALWMNLAAIPPSEMSPSFSIRMPGELAGWATPVWRCSAAVNYNTAMLVIDRREAGRLADWLIGKRASGGTLAWRSLRGSLADEAAGLFAEDVANLRTGIPPDDNASGIRSWTQAKADLAFQAMTMDPAPFPEASFSPSNTQADGAVGGLAAWASCGSGMVGSGTANRAVAVSLPRVLRVLPPDGYPATFPPPLFPADPWGAGDIDAPYRRDPSMGGLYSNPPARTMIAPQGGTLAPPVWFDIQSLAVLAEGGPPARGTARCSGRLKVSERLEFTSQEDFDNVAGGTRLAARGVEVFDPDPKTRYGRPLFPEAVADTRLPVVGPFIRAPFAHVVTLPRFNPRAFSGGPGASRCYGAVALAPVRAGHQGAKIYWPFSDDFDGTLNNGGLSRPLDNEKTDFWDEDPTFSPAPPGASLTSAFPVNPAPATMWDTQLLTPLFCTGTLSNFQCPGLDAVPTPGANFLEDLSIEFWLTPPSAGMSFALWFRGESGYTIPGFPPTEQPPIDVKLLVSHSDPNGPEDSGTYFELQVDPAVVPAPSTSWFIRDGDVAGPAFSSPWVVHEAPSWSYHVAVALQSVLGSSANGFRLAVNGQRNDSDGIEMFLPAPDGIEQTGLENIRLALQVDELRFHDQDIVRGQTAVPPLNPQCRKLFNLGRFVAGGTYSSPTYRLDEPARMGSVLWEGVVPTYYRALPVPPYSPVPFSPGELNDMLQVWVYAFDPQGIACPGSPRRIPDPGVPDDDLAGFGLVGSFRYEVRFDVSPVAPRDRTDSPVFESIGFTLRRPSRAPAWSAWEAR